MLNSVALRYLKPLGTLPSVRLDAEHDVWDEWVSVLGRERCDALWQNPNGNRSPGQFVRAASWQNKLPAGHVIDGVKRFSIRRACGSSDLSALHGDAGFTGTELSALLVRQIGTPVDSESCFLAAGGDKSNVFLLGNGYNAVAVRYDSATREWLIESRVWLPCKRGDYFFARR